MAIVGVRISLLAVFLAPTLAPVVRADVAEPAPMTAAEALRDNQIAGIIETANDSELESSTYAQTHTADVRVKEFADRMVKEHTQLGDKFNQLLNQLRIQGASSVERLRMQGEHLREFARLKRAAAADFNKLYLRQQVAAHEQLLDALDHKLLAAAEHADLKAFLTDLRATVAAHLGMAQDLLKTIDPSFRS